ncbi:hypothetical protein HJD18_08940 [Thermoleophilia bacterium SCSIO 60948]|nr:hypothetical protein HJD18_08940 [Thermoleophilia bacterium SCSIO 60948]
MIALVCALGLATPASALAHSDDMTYGELAATVLDAGGADVPPELLMSDSADATTGEPPTPGSAEPMAWYDREPIAPRIGSSDDDRYTAAGGCFALQSTDGDAVARSADAEYAGDARMADGEVFRFQPTELGSYILLGSEGTFPTRTADDVEAIEGPSKNAEWTLNGDEASGYTLSSPDGALNVTQGGALTTTGGADRFELKAAGGCAPFPEAEINASGKPFTAKPVYGTAQGTIDLHSHIMAFQAFGKGLHCGRAWSPLGVEEALKDCDSHAPNGLGAVEANLLVFQDPTRQHDPEGWPSFEGWPTYEWVFTHEQTYYRWIERSWRGGQRLLTFLAFDNSAACLINTRKTESCNEMDAVRRQLQSVKELEDYIDAQWGGPGKGFFRIVKNPYQARRVINRGKLAVVLGIEISEPFDCGIRNGEPQPGCNKESVAAGLDEVWDLGVRQMEIVNKFDNAFGGVAMDGGFQGPVINGANKLTTGEFWDVETCKGEESDREQVTAAPGEIPPAAAQLLGMLPGGPLQPPAYPPAPHCNKQGLTELGEFLVRQMADRGMIFDPDHLSVKSRRKALGIVKKLGYSGIVSSHSWSEPTSYRRIMEMGGVVTPMADHAYDFEDEWKSQRKLYREGEGSKRYGFGFGFGDDMNGFGGPRNPTAGTEAEISYPFRSPIDRGVMLDRQVSGTKSFDLNTDGIAHFGQWPDWYEGVRLSAGDRVIRDLKGGAESYLAMWERAVGVPGPGKKPKRGRIGSNGSRTIKLRAKPNAVLNATGQPEVRTQGWRWRVKGSGGILGAAFKNANVQMVASTARGYSAGGVRPGDRAGRVTSRSVALGNGLYRRQLGNGNRFVYGVAGGKVRFVGVATRKASNGAAALSRAAKKALG